MIRKNGVCKYCSAWEKKPDEWELGEILLSKPTYTFVGDGADYYDMPMSYCPVCGRKLAEPPKEET